MKIRGFLEVLKTSPPAPLLSGGEGNKSLFNVKKRLVIGDETRPKSP
ncbi:MAG: hypothetical protein LBD88_05100 [Candidatus Peribacteria bacterium]|jgi:hypothetical protein|nr:hypothetical protein [Candidatus Peribacteria bacterium]